jgi:sialate O-acetylesterase
MRRLLLLAVLSPSTALAAPALSPVWSDHAIVQRDRPIVVEGFARAGEAISATLGNEHQTATTDAKGRFALHFAARPASHDPLTLQVTGADGSQTAVHDILVGDVWLCSGQSNMELTVDRALNSYNNTQASADPELRMLTVPKSTAPAPRTDLSQSAAWQAASPQTTGAFSAACYYMAKALRDQLHIPIGAIHSSWGGSQIRAWLSPEGAQALYGSSEMALLARFTSDPLGAVTQFAPRWESWYSGQTKGSRPWAEPDSIAWQPVPKISPWNDWTDTPLAKNPVGTVWLRRSVTLTPAQAAAGATLSLGVFDELDTTWVNGHAIGNSFGWDFARKYKVPATDLKPGVNEILVAVSNSWGGGGPISPADVYALDFSNGEHMALGEGWRFSIAPVTGFPPRSPWDSNAGIGVMHNRMIAPLGAFAIKGAAWYQGESDVGIPGYRDRLRELFAGWRRQFGPQLRMLVVQLANYGPVQKAPMASGWAELREDQRQAVLADSNAALVTAIDLGERSDIHPANKVELGNRLALAAEGTPLPQPLRAVRAGDSVRVSFSGVTGGLATWSGTSPLSFELCNADQASCRYAAGRIEGDAVVLALDGKPATRVRYGWADAPVLNLFDGRPESLPGFELPIVQ